MDELPAIINYDNTVPLTNFDHTTLHYHPHVNPTQLPFTPLTSTKSILKMATFIATPTTTCGRQLCAMRAIKLTPTNWNGVINALRDDKAKPAVIDAAWLERNLCKRCLAYILYWQPVLQAAFLKEPATTADTARTVITPVTDRAKVGDYQIETSV